MIKHVFRTRKEVEFGGQGPARGAIVYRGTGGKTLEAQEHLAQGRSRGGQTRQEQLEGYQEMGSKGGQTRKEQLSTEGYQEMGSKGGQTRKEQLSTEGYQEMGRKGGQA